MRCPRLLALITLLLLWTVVGTTASAIDPGAPVTVDGTVTGTDGAPADDAVVLIGEDSTLTTFSPAELRTFAANPPPNLTVVEVSADGRFETTLGSLQAEAAVAVSPAGISDLAYIRGENTTLDLQLHERRPQTVHAHLGSVAADERRAELYVSLVNSGDTTIENLSVTVSSLPDGWSVSGVTTAGRYYPINRTLTWSSVPPGAEIDTTVVLSVPDRAPVGEYRVGLRADSATHIVDVAAETVEVRPEDTATPTRTPSPGGERLGSPEANEKTATAPDQSTVREASPTSATGPGFGTVTAGTALASVLTLLLRRE